MAQLKRAMSDGHLYILAGQSKGTWQVSDEGIQVLHEQRVRLPDPGESYPLDRSSWQRLWYEGLLFKKDIPYERRDVLASNGSGGAIAVGTAASSGLPLLLHMHRGEGAEPSWSLELELTALPDHVRAELRRHRASYISLGGAVHGPVPLRKLQSLTCPMQVAPQSAPYVVQWLDDAHQTHDLRVSYFTPGLWSTPGGNVFTERRSATTLLWRRCLSGGTVAFWGTLYWLARAEHDPAWPGTAQRVGASWQGWQLWRLSTDDDEPITGEDVAGWLNARHLTLARHTQRLELVTPPAAITPDGWIEVDPGLPLIVACAPPENRVSGLRPRLCIAITQAAADRSSSAVEERVERDSVSAIQQSDEPLYARWQHPRPGDYRIQLIGDVTAEPLFVRFLHGPSDRLPLPDWLHGLVCRLKAHDHVAVLTAFAEADGRNDQHQHARPHAGHEAAHEVHISTEIQSALPTMSSLTSFTASDLASLEWELEPAGVPVRVLWHSSAAARSDQPLREYQIASSDEMTHLWRNEIWSSSGSTDHARAVHPVSLILDASSFGRIECSIGLPATPQRDDNSLFDRAQRAELLWLARCCLSTAPQSRTQLPSDLRCTLGRLLTSDSARSMDTEDAGVAAALSLLVAYPRMPMWIVPRLRALLAGATHPPDRIRRTLEQATSATVAMAIGEE